MTPENTVLVFDGDCGFCTTWVDRLRRGLRYFPPAAPWQWLDLDAIGLSQRDVDRYVWLVAGEARFRGHAALAALLRMQPERRWRMLGRLLTIPPFWWAAALGYAFLARFRHRLPGGTPACSAGRPAA